MGRGLLLTLLFVPLVARADFDLYGYGPRAAAMAGAMSAEVNDYTAVFYNPAQMGGREDVNFGFQFQYAGMISEVQSTTPGRDVRCETCTPPPTVGTSVGLVLPLGGVVKNRLAFGLGVYLPGAVLLRLHAPSADTPYWYRYQTNPERLQLHLSAGVKIFDWLKVGAGIQVLANLIGDSANIGVDLFSKQVTTGEINAYLGTRVSPVFSLHSQPIKRLRLGATFRWAMQLDYRIPATVDIEGIGILGFVISGTAHFTPHTLQFGAAFDVTEDFTVSLDGQYQAWHMAPTPYVGVARSGPTLEGLGLGSALDVRSATQPAGFADTFGGRLGAEYRITERFMVRAGGFYRPTPVPRQDTAGTNLLDSTTVGASLGIGFNFPDPLEIFSRPISIDVAGQAHFLLRREAQKASTDRTPSYSYAANVIGVTAAIRYDF